MTKTKRSYVMKRVLTVSAKNGVEVSVNIKATILTKYLSVFEADYVRAKLADEIMLALTRLPYSDFRISEVRVKSGE